MDQQLVRISETIRDHLIKQRCRAMIGESCLYLDLEGRSCAVGCLIDGEHYQSEFEGDGVTAEVLDAVYGSLEAKGYDVDELPAKKLTELLEFWQVYHDSRGPDVGGSFYQAWLDGWGINSPEENHLKALKILEGRTHED